jgi:Mitochondrial ribosomal protein (VAR1)
MNSLSLFVTNNTLVKPGFSNSSPSLDLLPKATIGKWYLIEDLQKILVTYFKSMYSLISKAKFKVFAEKITVQILYYITIPDANIFTWYMIFNKRSSSKKLSFNNSVDSNPSLQVGSGVATQSAHLDEATAVVSAKDGNAFNNMHKINKKKLGFLKRKNKLINLLKKKIQKIGARDRFFELNLKSINYLYQSKFNSLVRFFNFLFQKPIEFLLIRLHHSDADSNILAQLVLLVLKKKNIRRIINKLYNKNKVKDINKMKFSINRKAAVVTSGNNSQKVENDILSFDLFSKAREATCEAGNKFINLPIAQSTVYLSGLYIHIGGRLMREPIIPRRTTKKFEKGAIAVGKVNSLEETSITKKNRKGAYTIKIIFAQNLIQN